MLASRLMTSKKLTIIIDRWRAALVIFGVMLTVMWMIFLVWVPLCLLNII